MERGKIIETVWKEATDWTEGRRSKEGERRGRKSARKIR